jgi:RHS repeat-associated protein
MNACDRAVEFARAIELEITEKVVDLWREYVNAWLECNGHPEDLTRNSADIRRLAQEVVGRFDNPYITVEDTELQIGFIIAGKENSFPGQSKDPAKAADPITPHNGQFSYAAEDCRLAGAGIDFVFTRTYKNQGYFIGPIGANWNHAYNHALRIAGATIFRSTGDLRVDAYHRHPKFGQSGFNYWRPPDGQDGVIVEQGASFVWRAPHGVRHFFEQDTNPFLHRLARIEDRNGNYLALDYDQHRLARVRVNHPDRFVTFHYDESDRLTAIRDFTGRQWSYGYDDFGDLVSATTPATQEYIDGLTTCYEYSSSQYGGELAHNLLRIIDPAGRIFLENEYGTGPGTLEFNRVVRQRQGGGEYAFAYEDVDQSFDIAYSDDERPAHRTRRTERNGQVICQVFNRYGQTISESQRVLEHGVLRELTAWYRYNRDGALTASLSPEGAITQHLYGREYYVRRHGAEPDGSASLDALTVAERQGFGRLLATVTRGRRYDWAEMNLARGVWGDLFPDILGGLDPNDAIAKFTYEPTYGQLLTVSDPRFTRSADPAAQTAAQGEHPRYEQTLTRNVYRGPTVNPASDPTRLLGEIHLRTPTLPDGTIGGPIVQHLTDYDERGRLLRSVDASGKETITIYFGSADGVLEGFVKRTVIDPAGFAITTEFEPDALGRVIAVHAPRAVDAPTGHFVTRTTYNALDQVVSITGSLPFAYTVRRSYDRSGKLIREERDARDETGADLPDAPAVRTWRYDEELNLIEESSGGYDLARHTRKRHRYNRAGQRILTVLPNGNRIRYRYDERQLQVAQITGADSPEQAITRTEYDGDGQVRALINARGYKSTFTCDPFGNVIATEDALGNVIRRDFDKADQIIRKRIFEKRADGFYLLYREEIGFDELRRAVRQAVDRFDNPPGPLSAAQLASAFVSGPPPGATSLVGLTFYNEGGNPVSTVDALGRQTTYEYDSVGRPRVITDPLGNQVVNAYDANGNLVRQDRIDLVRDPNNPAVVLGQRVFPSAATFDELDRCATSTDSLGNVTTFGYDSRGLETFRRDALNNIVRTVYDIRGRRVAHRCELTTTGLGGSPLEALVEKRFEYDQNGNLIAAIDALGRRMEYAYDALDRARSVTFPDGSTLLWEYDADGYLIRHRDANGTEQRHTVDAIGRSVRVDIDASQALVPIGGATFAAYEYDAMSRRVSERNDFARSEMHYNSLGSVLTESVTFLSSDAPAPGPFVLAKAFDDVGSVVGLEYPNGRRIAYGRNDLNRIVRLNNLANGTDYPGDPLSPAVYEIARFAFVGRQPLQRICGNGTATTYSHDGAGRLIQIDHAGNIGSFLRIQLLADAVGNVRLRNDFDGTAGRSESFFYDSIQRLVHEQDIAPGQFDPTALGPATSVPTLPLPNRQADIDAILGPLALPPPPRTYDYDLAGNRRLEQDGTVVQYTTNALDQYTQVVSTAPPASTSFTFEPNGNLRSAGGRTYVHDAFNLLVRVDEAGSTAAEFFHDARGRRVLERRGGETLQILWDGQQPNSEYRGGVLTAQFVYTSGVNRLVQVAARNGLASGGAEYWYHTDGLGSVRLLTARDGTPAASYAYEPFGQARGQPSAHPYNPYRFAGMRFDPTLGTYNAMAREYDPALGRFIERDPAGLTDGGNLYTYAANAPLSQIDPTGTEARPELTRAEEKQYLDAHFKKYWDRLGEVEQDKIRYMTAAAPEEDVPGNRKKVQRVFKVYRAILQEIQDATVAHKQIDEQGLWSKYHHMDWEDRAWMHICSRCQEEPSFADLGPFGGESIMGVNVAEVFGVVTGSRAPKPSLADRITEEVLKVVIVFGPDLAIGMEMAWLRNAAVREGMAAAKIERLPLTELEYRSVVPGNKIAMGTYGSLNPGPYWHAGLEEEARNLGYRTLGTYEAVPLSVRRRGKEAIVQHEIERFLNPAERIGFWLTGEEHLHTDSITYMELMRHLDDPVLFNKTDWFVNPQAVEWVNDMVPETPGVVDILGRPDLPVRKIRLPE